MITGHVWRPVGDSAGNAYHGVSRLDRPCWFMNCRRARTDHQREASGKGGGKK